MQVNGLTTKRTHPILVVEDSPEDYEATVRAFKRAGVLNNIYHCEDGDEALDYLRHENRYATGNNAPRPGIILLDLNLPGTDGREVLQVIKTDPRLKTIPVIILSTSSHGRDIEECYRSGANSYVQKPVNMSGFQEAIRRLKDFWFEIVVLPEPPRSSA